MNRYRSRGWSVVLILLATGCREETQLSTDVEAKPGPAAVTNRIDIPGPVRSNLGITFARVERRLVSNTLRVPGRFELLPTARVEHHTPLRGRIEIVVRQLQRITKGDVLFRLDSPGWRDLQRELSDTMGAIDIAEAQLEAIGPIRESHQLHEQGLQENIDLWTARIEKLTSLGAAVGNQAQQMAEAQSKVTESRSALGEVQEKDAELELRLAETESRLRSVKAKHELLVTSAATLLSVSRDELLAPVRNDKQEALPYWQTVSAIEMRASSDGTVERFAATNGSWAEQGALVLTVVDPTQMRFRAMGLQSDLDRLRTGLSASIVNPAVRGERANEGISTVLELGLNADPDERTIELFATPSKLTDWTRPGVSAFLEIATEQGGNADLAIPLAAVVRDGLKSIFFRRDPANPDKVIRMEADLGMNDGRWVVINSGVREGDEIVLDGVYQLLLATSGAIPKGGHFHADGTFHEGPD